MDRKTRRERILEHIGRYHFSIRPVIQKLFFEGKSCDNVLQALIEQGLVQVRGGALALPGGWSYYQLAPGTVAQLTLPSARGRPLSPTSLERNLAILWFCCMSEPRCARLDHRHLIAHFGADRAGDYALELSSAERVYRLFVVSPNARTDYYLKAVRADLDAAHGNADLARHLAAKRYGYALLVSSRAWKAKAEEALRKTGLAKAAPFRIQTVPSAATLPRFLAGEPPP